MDRNRDRVFILIMGLGVALRKESVDRNECSPAAGQLGAVALRKESVDRNTALLNSVKSMSRRSPQGERG